MSLYIPCCNGNAAVMFAIVEINSHEHWTDGRPGRLLCFVCHTKSRVQMMYQNGLLWKDGFLPKFFYDKEDDDDDDGHVDTALSRKVHGTWKKSAGCQNLGWPFSRLTAIEPRQLARRAKGPFSPFIGKSPHSFFSWRFRNCSEQFRFPCLSRLDF